MTSPEEDVIVDRDGNNRTDEVLRLLDAMGKTATLLQREGLLDDGASLPHVVATLLQENKSLRVAIGKAGYTPAKDKDGRSYLAEV